MRWRLPPGSLARASILTRARSSPRRNSAWGGWSPASGVEEVPGSGLKRSLKPGEERLGSAEWCGVESGGEESEVWYRRDSQAPVRFRFDDRVRSDAGDVVAALKRHGYRLALLSGDRNGRG